MKETPIGSFERQVPALWDMATAGGRRVAVVGMWASHPAEPVRGLAVSDLWLAFDLKPNESLPPGVVYPPEAEERARHTLHQAYRDREGYEILAKWLPGLGQAEFDEYAAQPDPYAHPVSALRQLLLERRGDSCSGRKGTPRRRRPPSRKPWSWSPTTPRRCGT